MMQSLCGMRLNTAGVVIGWVGAIFSFFGVIICSFTIANPEYLVNLLKNNEAIVTVNERFVIIISTIYLTFSLINLVASALLVAGTIKERHLMLVPWLVNSGVGFIYNIIHFISVFINAKDANADLDSLIMVIVSASIILIFQFIIWYTIYSLFKKLQAGMERQRLLGPAITSPSYTKI